MELITAFMAMIGRKRSIAVGGDSQKQPEAAAWVYI
jgi:hypothetical protein